MRRFLRYAGWSMLCVMLIALIAFNMLVVWVATGPRSLKEYIPAIEARINNSQSDFNIKVEDIALVWDGWQHPIDTRLRQIKIFNKKNVQLASFEQISATADLLALVQGQIRPNSIVLYSPIINVYRKSDGSFALNLGQDLVQGPELPKPKNSVPIKPLSEYLKDSSLEELSFLSKFSIENGTLNVGDTQQGILLTLQNANITFKRLLSNVELTIRAEVIQGAEKGNVYIQSNVPFNSLAAISKITLHEFKPQWIAGLSNELDILKGANVPLSGWVNTNLDEQGNLIGASLKLNAGKGEIISEKVEGVFPVDSAVLEGKLSKKGVLLLNNIQLATDGVQFQAEASGWRNEQKQLGIKLNARTGPVDIKRVKNFWPPWQSPESREWVVTNLSKGKATSTEVLIDIQPGQLELPKLPDKTVDVNIHFEKMNVRYKPEHPEVTNASGTVHLNANQLKVNIAAGDYLTGTKITNSTFFIGDLMADNPLMELSVNADAPAVDIATFLAYPDLALAEPLGITKDNLKGKAKGKAALEFSYYAPRDKNGKIIEDELVKYDIDATLENVSQQGFLHKYDISNTTGQLKANNANLTFVGNASVFGDALKTSVTHYFHPKDAVETDLDIEGAVSTDTLQKIGVNVSDYVRGNITTKANIKQAPSSDITMKAGADLTASEMSIAELQWKKAKDVAANAVFELKSEGTSIEVSSLNFTSGNTHVIGSMLLNTAEEGVLQAFRASTFKMGVNDLAVEYIPIEGGYKISAMGPQADLSPWFKKDDSKKVKDGFTDIPALDLQLNIAKATLDENRVVQDLKGVLKCNPSICEHGNITGNFEGGKPFAFNLTNTGGKRSVKIISEDAGAFLKGLDVYDNMEDGKLEISGSFDDTKAGHPLSGKLFIWDFQLKNTPVLSRIVSLASFGGLLDALSGKGLVFDKLKSDFTLKNDVIEVKDLGTLGGSMGISSDGTINIKQNTLALKGTVVPANTINSLLKNIPLVGDILTGGEGIIAVVYTVEGNTDEPDVSVNPLSALAPGFLRKIFE